MVKVNRKRKERENEVVAELASHIETETKKQSLSHKDEGDLFFLDYGVGKSKRKQKEDEKKKNDNFKNVSAVERKLISRSATNIKKGAVVDVDRVNDSNSLRDIWADDDSNSNSNTKTKRQVVPLKRKLAVPNPGFSYNPRKDNHQDAIAEALALEIEKRDKVDAEKKNDNDDDENDNTNGFSNPRSKPKNRAQRNKERARKVLEYEKSRERLELQVLGEVEKIPLLLKEIEKDERERALKKALKNNKQSTLSTLTYEEAGLIPLSDELNGSLRRIKPKGAGIKIRANDMKTNGDLVTEGKRKRRAYEKPKADRNVVWTPKYKYQ